MLKMASQTLGAGDFGHGGDFLGSKKCLFRSCSNMEFGRSDDIKSDRRNMLQWSGMTNILLMPTSQTFLFSSSYPVADLFPYHFRKQGLGPDDSLHVAERLYLKGEGTFEWTTGEGFKKPCMFF